MAGFRNIYRLVFAALSVSFLVTLASCAPADIPDARSAKVPAPTPAHERYEGINEKRDPITYVRLGKDMLVPQPLKEDAMPSDTVGPFELRGETLATALQLVLDDYDVSIAFESDVAFERQVTVANLRGPLGVVVDRVCALANLYCHFEEGNLTVKETETFVVDLPPLGNAASSGDAGASTGGAAAFDEIAAGLEAITGEAPTVDATTRLMIYTATQRTQRYAKKYFERLRKNTALVIFETNIWEVALDHSNRTGIQWNMLVEEVGGNFSFDMALPGTSGALSPITITPAYTGSGTFSTDSVLEFISARGAVKTVSQPQITVLSGSSATLTVTQEENFVSGVTRTPGEGGDPDTVSTTTETIETGLTMTVSSAWDESTIYGGLNIELDDLLSIDEFNPDVNTTIQLPQTTNRSLQTEIRVRPGDAILIGGLVSERDNVEDSGPGFMDPLFATTRRAEKVSSELVFLLRPRVVVFLSGSAEDTPAGAWAPKEGIALKSLPVPDITKKIKNIFEEEAISPLADLTSSVKKLFSTEDDESQKDAPVRLQKPVSDFRHILSAPVEPVEEETLDKPGGTRK